MDDWRLMGQEKYLQGQRLTLRTWSPYRDGWDHDHCSFCQRHISVPLASDDSDAVDRGYVTDDNYNWVCEDCFSDFRERFEWSTASDARDPSSGRLRMAARADGLPMRNHY